MVIMAVPLKNSSEPLFTQYAIDKTYTIRRTNSDGTKTVIDDPREKEKILNPDFFQGSIMFTRDEKFSTLVHLLIYIFQKIQAFLTGHGRLAKTDAYICHGAIILGGVKKSASEHLPFLVAHLDWDGVQTYKWNLLQDKDLTDVIIFRPNDERLQELIKKRADRTAFVKNRELRIKKIKKNGSHEEVEISPKQKHSISKMKMFLTSFHNRPHTVCKKHGPICHKSIKRVASLFADTLLKQQVRDDKDRPVSYFCTPYAIDIVTSALFLKGLEGISKTEKRQFLRDKNNNLLTRKFLVQKIVDILEQKASKGEASFLAHKVKEIYDTHKLIRLDSTYLNSTCAVRKLESLSRFPKATKQEISHKEKLYEKKHHVRHFISHGA